MSQRSFKTSILWALLAAALAGCERQGSSTPTPDPAERPSGPATLSCELIPITPLLPRLKTHTAIDSRGNLYWVQESEPAPPGGDLVFVMGTSGVPQTIPALSAPRLLAALGLEGSATNTGAIRSMAVGPGDELYVLFTGGRDRTPLCAIARYTPSTGVVKIMAGSKRMMEESEMGPSIDLARGSLVSYASDVWLWLRHTDAVRVMRLVPTEGGNVLEMRKVLLRPPPEAAAGQLTSEQEDLAGGPGQSLYYVDRPRAILWKIDSTGEYTAIQSLDGFSSALSAPAVDADGSVSIIAGDADPLLASSVVLADALVPKGAAPTSWVQLAYPAFIHIDVAASGAQVLHTIKRDDFLAPAALPVQDLHPRHLLLDRTNGTLITFDASSGELLRVKISRK